MSRNSKTDWNKKNVENGMFGDLLERMTTQFAPNHGSSHYQSGFVPAANPPWPSHSTHSSVMTLDPSLGTGVDGMNPLRSYSTGQEHFSDIDCNRTPLMRSSSDLGIRLSSFPSQQNNFTSCQLEDNLIRHQIETLNDAIYSDNASIPLVDTSPYQQLPLSKSNEVIEGHSMHYTPYMSPQSNRSPTVQDEQSCNFSTKLSNFTASLGTWLSPLDQLRTDFTNPTGNSEERCKSLIDNIQSCKIDDSVKNSSFDKEKSQSVTKPSYSDVLTKPSVQEAKTFASSTPSKSTSSNSYQNGSGSSTYKSRGETPLRPSNHNRSNKNRGNVNANTHMLESTSISKHTSQKLNEVGHLYSKVGLDNFELPHHLSTYNQNTTNNLPSLSPSYSKSANNSENTLEKTKKWSSLTSSGESSPIHQLKKSNNRKNSEKFEDKSKESSEHILCDKLNNHSMSTHQKQTPKRTSFINNNFTSSSVTTTNNVSSCKANNTDGSGSVYQHGRKGVSSSKEKEEVKFINDKIPVLNPSSLAPLPPPRFGGGSNNPRGGRYANRGGGGGKDPQGKRGGVCGGGGTKRKKEANGTSPSYSHSDLLTTGWSIGLLWMSMAFKAGLWLLRLFIDTLEMASNLGLQLFAEFWESTKAYEQEARVSFKVYWSRFRSYFLRKSDNKRGGRNDKKSPFGLENNIPLPATGEEAMKRLLACRGKDPYSILGVTRNCTDEDVKKYYKRQAFLVHPDKNKQPGAEEAFKILAHAFEIIGEPERREQYDNKLAEEVHFEGATGELASLLNLLKEKLEEAANTIRCTNCNKRHKRIKMPRPIYSARHCADCQIKHAAREGDIWAESWHIGIFWKYYACMEGSVYDISEWASCQRDNLKHLQANTHSVQYRIVSGGKKTGTGKNSGPECPPPPTDPELEEFFNNLCRERFGRDFSPPAGSTPQSGSGQGGSCSSSDARKRRGKKKK